MGFEPQTAGLPLVNVRKRTTKVNLCLAAGVVIFLAIGLWYAVRTYSRADRGEPVRETPAARK